MVGNHDKLKLYGFNNLTKALSFNIYDVCYAKSAREQKDYIAYIDEQYNSDRLTKILCDVTAMIGAHVLNISKQDYDPQGASVNILITEENLPASGIDTSCNRGEIGTKRQTAGKDADAPAMNNANGMAMNPAASPAMNNANGMAMNPAASLVMNNANGMAIHSIGNPAANPETGQAANPETGLAANPMPDQPPNTVASPAAWFAVPANGGKKSAALTTGGKKSTAPPSGGKKGAVQSLGGKKLDSSSPKGKKNAALQGGGGRRHGRRQGPGGAHLHLDKSHVTVHTFPEYHPDYPISTFRVDIDVSTCGAISPLNALDYLIGSFDSDIITIDYRVRGFTRDVEGKKFYIDHDIASIQDYIDDKTLTRYDAIDVNVYQSNIFHTKMLIKEIELQNYLFNKDVYELPPKERLNITANLRKEMIEIFSGMNIY